MQPADGGFASALCACVRDHSCPTQNKPPQSCGTCMSRGAARASREPTRIPAVQSRTEATQALQLSRDSLDAKGGRDPLPGRGTWAGRTTRLQPRPPEQLPVPPGPLAILLVRPPSSVCCFSCGLDASSVKLIQMRPVSPDNHTGVKRAWSCHQICPLPHVA